MEELNTNKVLKPNEQKVSKKRKRKIIFKFVLPLIILSIGAGLGNLWPVKMNEYFEKKKIPNEIFATFEDQNGNPEKLTSSGSEWGIFGDSKENLRSSTFWRIEKEKTSTNYVMKLDVTLDSSGSGCDFVRYTGIFANFSPPPFKTYDLSNFSGISFDFKADTLEGRINAFIQLEDFQTNVVGAWHLAQFNFDTVMRRVTINFSQFQLPDWYFPEKKLSFDTKNIYKIAFLFKSESGNKNKSHAIFEIDNIKFIK